MHHNYLGSTEGVCWSLWNQKYLGNSLIGIGFDKSIVNLGPDYCCVHKLIIKNHSSKCLKIRIFRYEQLCSMKKKYTNKSWIPYSVSVFWANFWHFAKGIFCENFPFSKKDRQKSPQLPTIWKGAWGFLLSYFEFCKILLSILMDSLHLMNITNLENNSDPTTLAVSTDVYQVINFENVNSTNRIF
jgi:hypothetical protein